MKKTYDLGSKVTIDLSESILFEKTSIFVYETNMAIKNGYLYLAFFIQRSFAVGYWNDSRKGS